MSLRLRGATSGATMRHPAPSGKRWVAQHNVPEEDAGIEPQRTAESSRQIDGRAIGTNRGLGGSEHVLGAGDRTMVAATADVAKTAAVSSLPSTAQATPAATKAPATAEER